MEHERFRHVEIELFVQSSKLEEALALLRTTLKVSGGGKATRDRDDGPHVDHDRDRDRDRDETDHLRGKYCHHYPICVRKVLPDDTHLSMASNAGLGTSKPATPTSRQALVDEPWYSITLTNYQTERQREGFNEVSSFLARSMARRFGARLHWGKLFPLARGKPLSCTPHSRHSEIPARVPIRVAFFVTTGPRSCWAEFPRNRTPTSSGHRVHFSINRKARMFPRWLGETRCA